MTLTREQILSIVHDRNSTTVPVPEWDGDALLRPLSAREADALYDGNPDKQTLVRRLVTLSLVDESGTRLFGVADTDTLFDRSFAAVSRLTEVALRINGFTKDAVDDAKKA